MGFQKLPTSLPMDKLFLDVKLEAIPLLGTNLVDLTGKRTFTVSMMKQNKGFGIIDINIETKASLQPIVDITFKDLYGNTTFDSLNDSKATGTKVDYSLLFDWPPPKFRFTFKGYLGKPVTWIMNLKKTHTRYNSSDGSFEIKASFVPNQWGFLSDIPFLYLLAKKRLKKDLEQKTSASPTVVTQNKIESIFDIIKIGKTIETKTKQITKEFDKLQKQLSVLKANAIDGLINKDFEAGDVIDGKVSGRQPIKGIKGVSGQNDLEDFKTITIKLPPSLSRTAGDNIKFQETLKSLKSNPQLALNEHRKILALIGNPNGVAATMFTLGSEAGARADEFQNDVKAGIQIIDNNLKLIDVETKRRLFETSSTQLGAVTISEVFSRVSADGAFILGSILDAGYTGYFNHPIRMQNKLPNGDKLIGRFFPLTIDQNTGEQIPAVDAGINDLGSEMDFVRKFIVAISEGIAANQTSQNEDGLGSQENLLNARISNLEIINPNPYKDSNSQQIIENLLLRSGIAAYLTRSFDPNKPGDYDTSVASLHADNDSSEEIKQLADKELKNISDSIISSLSTEDYSDLKNFCRFINNFLDVDGVDFLKDGEEEDIPLTAAEVKQFEVRVKKSDPINGDTFESLGTVDNVFRRFVGPTSIFFEGQPKGITDSINYDNFLGGYIYNNNTLWMLPQNVSNKYSFVVFNNSTNRSAIDSVFNNDSDSEFNDKDSKESDEPLGIVKLTNASTDENKNPDEIVRLETINKYIDDRTVFDYSRLQNLNEISLINDNSIFYPNTDLLNGGKGVLIKDKYTEDTIGNGITYLVYSHVTKSTDFNPQLAWGLFKKDVVTDRRGTNQRIFLRRICIDLENRMNKIEDEKNNVLSQVLGKAQSSENSLYIQMHHIFHQWGVLGNVSVQSSNNSDGSGKISEQQIATPGKMALKLENDYGSIVEINASGQIIEQSNVNDIDTISNPGGTVVSMGFRYDFPTERIMSPPLPPSQRTNVAHSIINIEPLYKPNANTTLLNIIQQLCTKNNFMFVPIPGNRDYTNINNIFTPSDTNLLPPNVGNVFHVLFTPTPESRTKQNDGTPLNLEAKQKIDFDAFEIDFGSPTNPVVKNLDVSTDESRPTAESILNLQRLVDKDNSNKAVTTDCSILSVMEGRSYKMKVELLGNAQISPMQYFYVARMPIFSGLYQVMNVTHSIKPNDMSTTVEGIKMRFDGSSMKGIGPITLESLKALGTTSNTVQPGVGVTSPNIVLPTNIFGAQPANNLPASSNDELDLIPGTYRNNNKVPISLARINNSAVEINTAVAYLEMKKAFDADNKGTNLVLTLASGYRPPYDTIDTVSSKGFRVRASSQYSLRAQFLREGLNVGTAEAPEVIIQTGANKGTQVGVDSPLLVPQLTYFTTLVAPPATSSHGNGIALDIQTGTRIKDAHHIHDLNEEVYSWLVKNSWKYGFVRTVAKEVWHYEYNIAWAKLGPYGGFIGNNLANVSTPAARDKALFYEDLGLNNLVIS